LRRSVSAESPRNIRNPGHFVNDYDFYWTSMKKLYVGNLPYTITEADLLDLFAPYGPVSFVKIPTDRVSGKGRGFAFVEIEDDAQADAAISELDGTDFSGRTLRINEARPQNDRAGGGQGGGRGFRSGNGNGGGGRRRGEDSRDWF
jgi:cold-inducible RNA-binding protein